MIEGRGLATAAAALLWLATAASAQTAASAPEAPAPAITGTVGATTRLGTAPGARRPRTFRECARDAQARRLRGMERRRFVARCQAGSGRPLFRRRGPPPPAVAPPPGAAPAPR